jgi:hypothetical protein
MPEPLERLLAEGLVRREGERTRTTARWQGAMARAALALQRAGAPMDLRLPVVAALLERFPAAGDEELAELVEVMLPIEEAELASLWGRAPADAAGP